MLNFLRTHRSSFAAKLIIITLIIAMFSWSFGVLFSYKDPNTAFQLGPIKISNQDIVATQQALQNNANTNNMNLEVSKEMALDEIIRNKLFYLGAYDLDMHVNKDFLIEQIAKIPFFLDKNNNLDSKKFESLLKNNNISKKKFFKSFEEDILSGFITNNFHMLESNFNFLERNIIDLLYFSEKRTAKLAKYSLKDIKIPTPSEEELLNIYNKNRVSFLSPHKQKFEFITVNCSEIPKNFLVEEDVLKEKYIERLKQNIYSKPEIKNFWQVVFKKDDKAAEAAELFFQELQKTPSKKEELFAALDKSLIIENASNITVEGSTKANLMNDLQKIWDNPINEIHKPITSPLGIHVLETTQIIPPRNLEFAEVRGQLQTELREVYFCNGINKQISNIVDSKYNTNKSLEEIIQGTPLSTTIQQQEKESAELKKHFSLEIYSDNKYKRIYNKTNDVWNKFSNTEQDSFVKQLVQNRNKHNLKKLDVATLRKGNLLIIYRLTENILPNVISVKDSKQELIQIYNKEKAKSILSESLNILISKKEADTEGDKYISNLELEKFSDKVLINKLELRRLDLFQETITIKSPKTNKNIVVPPEISEFLFEMDLENEKVIYTDLGSDIWVIMLEEVLFPDIESESFIENYKKEKQSLEKIAKMSWMNEAFEQYKKYIVKKYS